MQCPEACRAAFNTICPELCQFNGLVFQFIASSNAHTHRSAWLVLSGRVDYISGLSGACCKPFRLLRQVERGGSVDGGFKGKP